MISATYDHSTLYVLYIDYFINLNKTLMSLVSLLLLFSYGLGQSGKVISPSSYVKES